jgi:glycine cleavage system H lipoate-binding protein
VRNSGDGWMVKISLADMTDIEGLLSAEEYIQNIGA